MSEDPKGFRAGDLNLFRYVGNLVLRYSDPLGLDRRTCSRNLNSKFTPFQIGIIRHDYAQFKDSNGNITTKSWGDQGMIDESLIDSPNRTCGAWKKSSDKADSLASEYANTLGENMDYSLESYNCQNFTEDVLNFQSGK